MPGNKGDYDNLLQGINSGAVTLEQVKPMPPAWSERSGR